MEKIEYKVTGNKLSLNTGNSVTFDYPINEKKVLIVNDLIIVMLEIPTKVKYNENVFAISKLCKIVWRVSFNKEELFYQQDDCCFIGLKINNEGQLVLFNWCDTAFIVDPQTGTIIGSYNTK